MIKSVALAEPTKASPPARMDRPMVLRGFMVQKCWEFFAKQLELINLRERSVSCDGSSERQSGIRWSTAAKFSLWSKPYQLLPCGSITEFASSDHSYPKALMKGASRGCSGSRYLA